jgi:hypothetical protein
VEHSIVSRAPDDGAYNHHPQITSHRGVLLASWSRGRRDEDTPGQAMVLARSHDGGRTWSPPRTLAAPDGSRGVCTAMGIRGVGARLIAYCGHYEMSDHGMLMYYACGGNMWLGREPDKPCHLNAQTRIYVSDDDGTSWRGPVGVIGGFVPNHPPSAIAGGRLIMPGNVRYLHTADDSGLDGWQPGGIPRVPVAVPDEPEGHVIAARLRGDEHPVCEGSFFQTDDGVIHMMLRTGAGRLAVSRSRDNGLTWSEPALTDYTDCGSRHLFGRLDDGRYFGLNCPQAGSQRTPLVLALSDDGIRFDRHFVIGDEQPFLARLPGVHKYGRYGYPSMHVTNGAAFVIYSINKEDIAVARIAMEDLS